MRAPAKKSRRARRQPSPPGSAVMSLSKRAAGGELAACFRWLFASAWAHSAQQRRSARRSCAPACRSHLHVKPVAPSTRRSISWSIALARHGLLEYRLGRARGDDDLVVIEPQLADYWPRTARLARVRYLRPVALCLHAPARQRDGAGIAARRRAVQDLRSGASRPRSPCCRHRSSSASFASTTASRGAELLALLLDCQILFKIDRRRRRRPAPERGRRQSRPVGLPRSPVSRAQHARAATPTRSAALIRTPASFRRCRRFGRTGPARRSTCASFRTRPAGSLAARKDFA